MPPVLYRQAKACGYCRPRRALPPQDRRLRRRQGRYRRSRQSRNHEAGSSQVASTVQPPEASASAEAFRFTLEPRAPPCSKSFLNARTTCLLLADLSRMSDYTSALALLAVHSAISWNDAVSMRLVGNV